MKLISALKNLLKVLSFVCDIPEKLLINKLMQKKIMKKLFERGKKTLTDTLLYKLI